MTCNLEGTHHLACDCREKMFATLLKIAKKVVEQLDRATATPYMDVDVNSLREAIAKAEDSFIGEPIFKSHGG